MWNHLSDQRREAFQWKARHSALHALRQFRLSGEKAHDGRGSRGARGRAFSVQEENVNWTMGTE